jgi:succinyl-diaminopimelate desuccinylase
MAETATQPQTPDALTVAQRLIRCESVTPAEGGALDYLEGLLTGAGFCCSRLIFSEPCTPDVDNLYARIGQGSPHVCFAGHTDVVPPGDVAAWTFQPFGAEVRDGVLYGRGAADMKGGVAAGVAAALAHLAKSGGTLPQGSISFLITGDEEGPAINGTAKVLEWMRDAGEQPDYCLLPECTAEEATADTIKIGRRGSLSVKLTVRGRQGHVAYPQKALNPLPALLAVLRALTAEPLDNGTEHFQPSNLEITSIDTGNTTTNLIPAVVIARFNIRFNTLHTAASLKAWIEHQARAALEGSEITCAFEYENNADCFVTQPGAWVQMLVDAVEAETGTRPAMSTAGGTSDARFIKNLCPVVEIGLRNATAHKVDEHVPIADLQTLQRIFERFLETAMRGSLKRLA